MAHQLELSSLDALTPKAPNHRKGVLRFREQVSAIDELIYDYDPRGTDSAPGDPDDAYEGVAVDVMRVLRDAESRGNEAGSAVRTVLPKAGHELVKRIVQAWDEN